MSLLDGLGLQQDPGMEAQDAPATPEATAEGGTAPEATAETTESVTGLTAQTEATEAPEEADEPIEVPEGAENPDAVRNAIAAERRAAREAYKRAREAEAKLAQIEEAAMPVEDRLKAVEARAAAAELEAKKLAVGMKHGLSLTFSQMLNGKDEGELETHAKSILAELHQSQPKPVVNLGGGPSPAPPAPADPAKAHNNFLLGAIARQRGA